ncbi:ninjurin-1 [Puma concolor]|uniref:Ninjurin-1 n=1 Tax=Puma concolor TaxID=9696 RepID=A0A6P6IGD9_PUMCO|nr:ninjurin-1 [Puma concolor]
MAVGSPASGPAPGSHGPRAKAKRLGGLSSSVKRDNGIYILACCGGYVQAGPSYSRTPATRVTVPSALNWANGSSFTDLGMGLRQQAAPSSSSLLPPPPPPPECWVGPEGVGHPNPSLAATATRLPGAPSSLQKSESGTEEFELNGDLRGLAGRPVSPPSRWGRNRPINVNHYANKKSAAESMLDIALLMANASQLKAVIEQGPGFAFFVPLVVLISISLVLQIGVGVLLIFLVRYDLNNPAKHAKLDFLNNLATGLVFIIVVVNIFITAFGVQKPVMDAAPRQ